MHEFAAAAFLIALILLLVGGLVRAFVRSPFTPVQTVLYWGSIALVRLLWRVEVKGQLHFPADRGAVVVANHRSSVDPFFLQTITLRKMHWMVAKEFFSHPLFGAFLNAVESIPTSRGGLDTAAIRTAIRYCQAGDPIGMLPEGRINVTEELLLPVRPGAILVALKARVPVIPCYLHGVPFGRTAWSPFFMPARVVITIGEPIDLSPYFDAPDAHHALEEIALRVMKEVARLAGVPDYQPRLAGRNWKPTAEQVAADMDARERRNGG